MTKQHFEAFAEEIRKETDARERMRFARVISNVALKFNPRFSWERFYEACGI